VLSQQPCSVSIGLFFCDTGLSLLFGGDGLLLSVGICSLLFIIFVFFALSSAAPAALIQCFQAAVCCAKCLCGRQQQQLEVSMSMSGWGPGGDTWQALNTRHGCMGVQGMAAWVSLLVPPSGVYIEPPAWECRCCCLAGLHVHGFACCSARYVSV